MKNKHALRALCLILALCLVPAAFAQSEPMGQLFCARLIDANEQLKAVAVLDGRAVLLSTRAFYTFTPGDGEARRVADAPQTQSSDAGPAVDSLFVHDGRRKGLHGQTGVVYGLTAGESAVDFEPLITLDLSAFAEERGGSSLIASFDRLAVQGDRLFMKLPNGDGSRATDLYSFDLHTGAQQSYTPRHLQGLVPYRDGKLIGIYHDPSQQGEGRLTVFDPAADTAEPLAWRLPEDREEHNRGLKLYYDAAGDSLYAAAPSGLMKLSPDGSPALRAAADGGEPVGRYAQPPRCMPDGTAY